VTRPAENDRCYIALFRPKRCNIDRPSWGSRVTGAEVTLLFEDVAEASPSGGKVHTGVVTQAGAGVRLVTAAQPGWLRTMSLPSAGSLLKTWHAQSPSHEV